MTDSNKNTDSGRNIHYNKLELKDWRDVFRESGEERDSAESPYLNETDINDILDQGEGQTPLDQDDVERALAGIEKRLTRLMLDISILSYGGYLDDIDNVWKYLDKIDEIDGELEENTKYMNLALRKSTGRDVNNTDSSYSFDLGFNTGIALSELTGTAKEDDRGLRFLHGFLEAYSTEHFQTASRTGQIETNDMSRLDPLHPDPLPSQDKVFKRNNIAPTDYLRGLTCEYKILSDKIDSLPDLSLVEATERYVQEKTDDWFEMCCHVRRQLDEEWNTIDDAAVPGPDIHTVLEFLWELIYRRNQINIESKDIRKEFSDRSTYDKSITQILNRLSVNGKNKSKGAKTEFEHNEIVCYSDSWELTDYGQLLLYHVFEKDTDPEWIHKASIQQEIYNSGLRGWTDEEIEMLEQVVEE